ncbi:hypothetical protein SAMN02745166_04695 [Prosthecobacter debontii]|uniref:Uncharacterized protein n=1 Tax=Prosthecobacter debontii TaxID=48467 RepID=A0A1T4Z067_9BACT|nr:hypothetical protein [Prosthecobacter debontii]SKB07439.1 hypothetical protein SAMN02745166_04695 [Prosthecobacter debontii]
MFDLTGIVRSFSSRQVTGWSGRRVLIIHAILMAGCGFALLAILRPSAQSIPFWLGCSIVMTALLEGVLAVRLPHGPILSNLRLIAGNCLMFAVMLGAAEIAFRIIGFDFNQTTDSRAEYPPCFRMAEQPLGDVYFQRGGPFTWTGKPLQSLLRLKHGLDNAYAEEAAITLSYDRDGFRNPPDLNDWNIVVAGDSFVESGSLPFDQIFTSQAARLLGKPIRNLGVCETGLLSHSEFLNRFGKSVSTRHAVLSFYDGNDVRDTEHEMEDLRRYQTTGQRPSRESPPQSSLAMAAYQLAKAYWSPSPGQQYQDAWLVAAGKEHPITLRPSPTPLDPEKMTPQQKAALESAIAKWAATAERLGLRPWLLYIPANNRTYHGLIRFSSRTDPSARVWQPGTLPEFVQALCQKHGVSFINTYPTLREAAEKGTLVYNPILDTHLNQEGSRRIGELLASQLSQAPPLASRKPRS